MAKSARQPLYGSERQW